MNLPNGCRSKNIAKAFGIYGKVLESYIARKRDKDSQPFGFENYGRVSNGKEFERMLRKIYLSNNKLRVNIARFTLDNAPLTPAPAPKTVVIE
ncbi:putative RNA recognition motif domain, nucleotide-binding alpha-beta plait domain superfamily [Helianthus anomalus]